MQDFFLDWGIAGAIIYIVVAFIRYIKGRDRDLKELFQNHLSHNTQALEKLCGVIEKLNDKLN